MVRRFETSLVPPSARGVIWWSSMGRPSGPIGAKPPRISSRSSAEYLPGFIAASRFQKSDLTLLNSARCALSASPLTLGPDPVVNSPRIPAAIFPTPPTTSPVDTTIAGTPIAAPMPVTLVIPPRTSPVNPPAKVTIPPKICPTATPRLASVLPWGSTPPASSSWCPTPAKGTAPSASPPRKDGVLHVSILLLAKQRLLVAPSPVLRTTLQQRLHVTKIGLGRHV